MPPLINNLVFLCSLPRSGSTMLGMMLGNHPEVLCPPEPWLQLAVAELDQPAPGCRLPYDEYTGTIASADFIRSLAGEPGGGAALGALFKGLFAREGGRLTAAEFSRSIYRIALASAGKRIFVDKTPRYYHALDFIDANYPEAKVIILKRNPLDIAASYKTTWNIPIDTLVKSCGAPSAIDFAKGLFDLERYGSEKKRNALVLAYEELVNEPEKMLKQLCGFLAVQYDPRMLAYNRNAELIGAQKQSAVGDRMVLSEGRAADTASIGKWRRHLSRDELGRLVNMLGGGIFKKWGYESVLEEIMAAGISIPTEQSAEKARAAVIECGRQEDGRGSLLGKWAYFIASTGADPRTCGELLDLLFRKVGKPAASFKENAVLLILDLVRRYRESESDRTNRLGVIEDLTAALRKAEQKRTKPST